MGMLYRKHQLIRTPWEGVAKSAQHAVNLVPVIRHPGLWEIYREDGRTDRCLRRLLTPSSNCIDVGAHIGSTLSLLTKLAPKGSHLAVEPVATKAAWLRAKFPDVEVHEMAASNTTGTVAFVENLTRPGFSGLRASSDPSAALDEVREIEVACNRLDDIVETDRPVHLLKIDVEGAEQLVLEGAAELLERDRPAIVFESGPGRAEEFGLSNSGLYSLLVDGHGYEVFLFKDHLAGRPPLGLAEFRAAHVYPFLAFNFLALAVGRACDGEKARSAGR